MRTLFIIIIALLIFLFGLGLNVMAFVENWKYKLTDLGSFVVYWKGYLLMLVGGIVFYSALLPKKQTKK